MTSFAWPDVRPRLARPAPHQPPDTWAAPEPPLTPAEPADLHRRLGVDLPPDHQQFLLHVGRGAPGPGFLPVPNTDGR